MSAQRHDYDAGDEVRTPSVREMQCQACERKDPHATWFSAARAAKRARRNHRQRDYAIVPFQCPVCGKFHCGNQLKKRILRRIGR